MCCGILPGVVNIPIVLMQEGLLPKVAGQPSWEAWISVNRANPFLPPHQWHFFRKPKYCLSIIIVEAVRLIAWLFLWCSFSPCEAAGREVLSPPQMHMTAVLSVKNQGWTEANGQQCHPSSPLQLQGLSTPAVTVQQAGIQTPSVSATCVLLLGAAGLPKEWRTPQKMPHNLEQARATCSHCGQPVVLLHLSVGRS